ncbi:hypothetical protein H0H93_010095, partial [Arthromyces matolae]
MPYVHQLRNCNGTTSAGRSYPMRNFLARSLSALLLADFFLAVATPIPFRNSGVVSWELSNTKFPSTDVAHLPIGNDGGQDIVARYPMDGDKEGPIELGPGSKPITIPASFFPPESPELEISFPALEARNIWGSVMNIWNLINTITKRDKRQELRTFQDTFEKELKTLLKIKSLRRFMNKLGNERTDRGAFDETKHLKLEALRESLKRAVELHNTFQEEIMIPKGFVSSPEMQLTMKVPYQKKQDAVMSVYRIYRLMRLATANNNILSKQLSNFRNALTHDRFNLDQVPTSSARKAALTATQFRSIQDHLETVVKQHNAGHWMTEEDIQGWNQDPGTSESVLSNDDNPPKEAAKIRERRSMHTPLFFLPVQHMDTKTLTMNVPPSDDTDGIKSVNDILTLMAALPVPEEQTEKLKKTWRNYRGRLVAYQLELMEEPEVWGTTNGSLIEAQNGIVDAIRKHNRRQEVYNIQQKRPAPNGVVVSPRQRRKPNPEPNRPAALQATAGSSSSSSVIVLPLHQGAPGTQSSGSSPHSPPDSTVISDGRGTGMTEGRHEKSQTPPPRSQHHVVQGVVHVQQSQPRPAGSTP